MCQLVLLEAVCFILLASLASWLGWTQRGSCAMRTGFPANHMASCTAPQKTRLSIWDCIYRFTLYWHSKEVRILMNVPMFSIITQEVFIVRHWFKHSHIPNKIRHRTISRRVGNGLNSLSYDETKKSQHGLRKVRHCVYTVCVAPW